MAQILWVCVALATGVYIVGPVVDPDLWWHIAAGRWIVANRDVPTEDYWNLFGVGRPWLAYSWSFESIAALIDGWWGVRGLLVAQIVLGATISIALSWVLSRLAGDYVVGLLLGMVVTASTFSHFTLRPQSVTWVLFALVLWCAEQIDRHGLQRRYVALLAVLFATWANLHLSAILPLGALGLWLWHKRSDNLPYLACGVGFIATLLTPYGGAEWLTFLAKSGHPLQYRQIAEFQPATVMQYPTAFLLLLIVVMMLFIFRRTAELPVGKLVVAWGFAFGSFVVIKFLPLGMISVAAVTALLWSGARGREGQFGEFAIAIAKLKAVLLRAPREGLAFVAICTMIVNCYNLWQQPTSLQTPRAAVDYLLAKQLPGPVLSTFGDGGYLMYRFSDARGVPSQLVAIDGRTNVTPPEILKKHTTALRGLHGWQEYLDAVRPETILWRNESPLVSILLEREDWRRVYHDGEGRDGFSLFIRAVPHG